MAGIVSSSSKSITAAGVVIAPEGENAAARLSPSRRIAGVRVAGIVSSPSKSTNAVADFVTGGRCSWVFAELLTAGLPCHSGQLDLQKVPLFFGQPNQDFNRSTSRLQKMSDM